MHFGHCQQFAFVDVDQDGNISAIRMVDPPQHAPGVFPQWVKEQGAEMVIAGGMGGRAQGMFEQQGVRVLTGAPADTPEAITRAWLDNRLETGANACDH